VGSSSLPALSPSPGLRLELPPSAQPPPAAIPGVGAAGLPAGKPGLPWVAYASKLGGVAIAGAILIGTLALAAAVVFGPIATALVGIDTTFKVRAYLWMDQHGSIGAVTRAWHSAMERRREPTS
jgi:hypothetical protein